MMADLDLRQRGPLVVEDVERDRRGHRHCYAGAALLEAFVLDRAQHVQRRRFGRPHMTGAAAMAAGHSMLASNRLGRRRWRDSSSRPNGLMRPTWMRARSLRSASFSLRSTAALLRVLLHVDEVDDDQAGQIAQAQLPRHFLRRFEIGAQRRLLDVAFARRAAGVDVDRDQRLGLVDDDVAARAQLHDRIVDGVDLAFDLVALEQRLRRISIQLHPLGMAGHQHAHEGLGVLDSLRRPRPGSRSMSRV